MLLSILFDLDCNGRNVGPAAGTPTVQRRVRHDESHLQLVTISYEGSDELERGLRAQSRRCRRRPPIFTHQLKQYKTMRAFDWAIWDVLRIVKIIFVIDETTEAATCKMFVTNTIVDIYEQKV